MSSRVRIRLKPDDNESVADSLVFLLDCYGHHAAVAYDGGTALRLLRTGAFEITFLDENLPDIKGEWCRMVAEGNADSLRGFPRFNEGRCQSGRHCRALRCLFAEARSTRAGHRRRSLGQRCEYSPSRLANCCRRKRTQPIVGGSTASLFRVTQQSEQQLSA
jgi:hypothetical protein